MRTHIDWITFTMTLEYPDETFEGFTGAIDNAFVRMFSAEKYLLAVGGEWRKREKSRAPYTYAWEAYQGEICLFANPNLTHCCVEISGAGCERLIKMELLHWILTLVHDRVTRIDIASDIETQVRPTEFVSQVSNERMRSSGHQVSETGETCYVGSKKSDRYARVYRYEAPHPRSHLLRVEHVFRRGYAKSVAYACVASGEQAVSKAAGIAFGWAHYAWDEAGGVPADITIVSDKRTSNNTVFWLIKACAPAFRRLVKSGDIKNAREFIDTYFLTEGEEIHMLE